MFFPAPALKIAKVGFDCKKPYYRKGRDLPFWTPKRVPEAPPGVPKPLRERLRGERERQVRFGGDFGVPGGSKKGLRGTSGNAPKIGRKKHSKNPCVPNSLYSDPDGNQTQNLCIRLEI